MEVALVTGGSKGIGLSVVKRLASSGYQVVASGRNAANWRDAVRKEGLSDVDFKEADISSESDIDDLFRYIESRYGSLSIAVNNASPSLSSVGLFRDCQREALKETLNADLWGQAQCIQHELQLMHRGSSIVNISSVNGLRPAPNVAMYGAAKSALESLTRSLALEAIKEGIRINAVAPGVTWTPRWVERSKGKPDLRRDVESVVPARRFAEPDEIANAVVWLCSPEATYIVGHTLVVDGGLSLA